MTSKPVEVALAILDQDGKFLMQLRDDIPGIAYPGVWGLFGGHIESGETPEIAVIRELKEEIGYDISSMSEVGCYEESSVIRHIFHGPLNVDLSQLVLNEGWDMALLTPEEIQAGQCYSKQAEMIRLVGRPHQRILLDFIANKSEIEKS